MAFNVMARNCDDHTKNHAFLLREGGRWELAPAYDVTHAYNPSGEWTYQHLMGVNGRFDGITRDDLMAVARRFGRSEAHTSELQSLMRISYAVFCLNKKTRHKPE